jgi:hypothetical protein
MPDVETDEPHDWDWGGVGQFIPAIVAGLVLLFSFIAGIFSSPVTTTTQLMVVAALTPGEKDWAIRGRVMQDGKAVSGAIVWSVVQYHNGQHDSPPATQTDEKGGFSLAPVLSTLGACTQPANDTSGHPSAPANNQNVCSNYVDDATIYVRKQTAPGWWWRSPTVLSGEDTVHRLGNATEPVEIVGLSPLKLAPLPAIFLVSAMLPFFGKQTRRKYLLGIVLAFIFTGLMIAYISLGLRYITTEGKAKAILELGFASIYRASYVNGVPPEWVFSFTARPKQADAGTTDQAPASNQTPVAPDQGGDHATGSNAAPNAGTTQPPVQTTATAPPKADPTPIDHGFGAPLWVLLVSVIGAGVLTVALLVGEINKMPEDDQASEILEHLQGMVEHQLFILFAPVSAIFVYQTMVVGTSASSSYTVALAALGAGPSLSALLTKAAASAANALGAKSDPPPRAPAETGP